MFGLQLKIVSETEETTEKLDEYYNILNKLQHLDYPKEVNKYIIDNKLIFNDDNPHYLTEEPASTDMFNFTCKDINSSGLDIMIPEDITIPAKSYGFKIKLGIACEPVKIWNTKEEQCVVFKPANCGYYLYPRSSLSKTPLRLANSIGIIDSSYRGELIAAVDNISDKEYEIKQGQRLFQLCSNTLEPINYCIVKELSDTERGEGGFGSTGK
jgi:dUTP pyrophosphatase